MMCGKINKILISCLIFILCTNILGNEPNTNGLNIPKADREFRAAWIATVANINWPSEPGLSVAQQKKEAIYLLDLLQSCNYNAAIFQVRPQADALYKSDIEPWSYFLTGQQGVAPKEYYDPLEFWIEEAHKRCIELHAWINPYRAHHKDGAEVSKYSVIKKRPELVVELKDGYWWFDPSLTETQKHLENIVLDIVNRYDIDGIHFDDYFYPYPTYNHGNDFPDDKSWNIYKNNGGNLNRKDWRRQSVNSFVKQIYNSIKLIKPHVKFGISPFGIWRPNNPKSIKGFDQYDVLFADAKLWINNGWIDYWTPQLYWKINDIDQSFPVLLGWWQKQNLNNRHLWPGSKIDYGSDETINQIMITRGMFAENPGNVHWSIEPLTNDKGLVTELKNGPYSNQALVPFSSWLSVKNPSSPTADFIVNQDSIKIEPSFHDIKNTRNWVLYMRFDDFWEYKILSTSKVGYNIPRKKSFKPKVKFGVAIKKNDKLNIEGKINFVAISSIDKFGNESEITKIDFSEIN